MPQMPVEHRTLGNHHLYHDQSVLHILFEQTEQTKRTVLYVQEQNEHRWTIRNGRTNTFFLFCCSFSDILVRLAELDGCFVWPYLILSYNNLTNTAQEGGHTFHLGLLSATGNQRTI